MGEFSITHWIIVIAILLIFFGPSRLPGLGKSLGEAIKGFKDGISPEDKARNTPPPAAPPQQLGQPTQNPQAQTTKKTEDEHS